jgi:nicotinate dehydrogenase subunit B
VSRQQPVASVLPSSLRANPKLGAWLRLDPLGHAAVSSGKVELGQGILGALSQIAAEELGLDLSQIRMVPATTDVSPNESVTSGSLSIQHSGAALRQVCAQARAIYLARAGVLHGVEPGGLHVASGDIFDGDHHITSYWEIADASLLEVDAVAGVQYLSHAEYRTVGHSLPREDTAQKVFGEFTFIHDLVLPRMVHGRMVRPPSPHAKLIGCDLTDVGDWPGVLAARCDGSLLGVVAETEWLAECAAARLAKRAGWTETSNLPDMAALRPWLQSQPSTTLTLGRKVEPAATVPPDAQTFRASYSRPFIRHASIGPSCALALFANAGELEKHSEIWTHSQGIYNLRQDLSLALGLKPERILVRHMQGAGCYGHNGADDVAFDAAWLALACPGRPVRVQWSRADELCWSPLGPAMVVDLEADVDVSSGKVLAWRHQSWSLGHGLRPGRAATPTLLGSWHLAQAFERLDAVDASPAVGGGGDRNAEPLYPFPAMDIVCRRVLDVPMRTSALRALGAFANVFAIESFMDELAYAQATDPVEFRIAQLDDARAIAVIRKVAAQADWQPRIAPAAGGTGRGIGFARYKNTGAYCAVVAHVEVAERVRVLQLHIVVDVGQAINPDGVRQQIEGGAIQATSWTLLEAAHFDRTRMLDQGWEQYPILRFPDAPNIDVLLQSADEHPSLGAGEAALGPTAAAIGNAVFDALGVRVRDLPMDPSRIVQAMDAIDAEREASSPSIRPFSSKYPS